jgi:hypothetical protein
MSAEQDTDSVALLSSVDLAPDDHHQGAASLATVSKSSASPTDSGKDSLRRLSESPSEDFTHKLKVYFPDRTYRNILCQERITAAEVKRRLKSRLQLPKDHDLHLVHAALDGSNFRVLFDSEFLQTDELRHDDVKAGDGVKTSRTYISSASLTADIMMVYLAKFTPSLREGDEEPDVTSAAMGRGFLSRRKPTSLRHRRYFFQLWRVKKMLALFKKEDEVHSVILLNDASLQADPGSDVGFVLRVPGEGDYSFLAESRMERDEWM